MPRMFKKGKEAERGYTIGEALKKAKCVNRDFEVGKMSHWQSAMISKDQRGGYQVTISEK